MRCKNCGWDNPTENEKCIKCNAPLTGSMVDEFVPSNERQITSEEYTPKQTEQGCSSCGYPMRLNDTHCPNCGNAHLKSPDESIDLPKAHKSEKPKPFMSGTVIQGTKPHGTGRTDYNNEEGRKKLVGFLVTYTNSINGKFYPLYEGRNFIGKNSSMNVCIQDDAGMSDKHFTILYRVVDKKFKFKDEQSTNGTFVNGSLMDEGELNNSDEIVVGTTKLTFISIPETAFE